MKAEFIKDENQCLWLSACREIHVRRLVDEGAKVNETLERYNDLQKCILQSEQKAFEDAAQNPIEGSLVDKAFTNTLNYYKT